MKKIILLTTIALMGLCATMVAQNNTTDEGIIINGIKWATRNVATPGKFAANSEDAGEYYQWNKGTTDFLFNDDYYDSVYADAASWLSANDPCPAGWRVPTLEEIEKLLDEDKVSNEWITVNGINGRKFTDKTTGNSIFLPAAGYRDDLGGKLYDVGDSGVYWGSTQYDSDDYNAYSLYFVSDSDLASGLDWNYKCLGRSIRPVAEK